MLLKTISQTAEQKNTLIPCLTLACPQERLFNASWMTFPVDSLEEDAVLMLFDVLYEKLAIFTRQYWLGKGWKTSGTNIFQIKLTLCYVQCEMKNYTSNSGSLWPHFINYMSPRFLFHQVSSRCRTLLTCIPFRWVRSHSRLYKI